MKTIAIIIFIAVILFYYIIPVARHYIKCKILLPQLLSLNKRVDTFSKKYGFDRGVDYFYVAGFQDIEFRYKHLKALAEIGEYEYSEQELERAFSELRKMYEKDERLGNSYWKARQALKSLTGYKFMTGIKSKGIPIENLFFEE